LPSSRASLRNCQNLHPGRQPRVHKRNRFNKMNYKRRHFLKLSAAGLVLSSLSGCVGFGRHADKRRIVVVGGGYAGATVAKYLRMWSAHSLEVVVIEPSAYFISCPLSNLVLGGSRKIEDLTFSYEMLKAHHNIRWVQDEVTAIDAVAHKVVMRRGEMTYDKLIIAPGVDFIYDHLPALQNSTAQRLIPHAWKAGPQTVNLRRQLEAMRDGDVFVISIPKMPFRCPPGPYERACQAAFYFRQHKPRCKVLVLDANPDIVSKKALFTKVWADLYPGIIEYRPDSLVTDVDVPSRTVITEFETVKSDVLNLIPPQLAGKPAQLAGAVNIDQRWCEVDFRTYESKVVPDVHIIGDAISAGLPKSAHMAAAQARVCASAIAALMRDEAPDPEPVFSNTCYSFVTDSMAMHVADIYRYDAAKNMMLRAEGGGLSAKPSELEGNYAQYWAHNIWSDALT
jgi:sulfide dehydrogenase [flavocytochrome c] flavoprotein subunit